jgi:hypothetical protein
MGGLAAAQTQPSVSGVIETYWLADKNVAGATQQFTWAEIKARVTDNWSTTWSGSDFGSIGVYDETYVRYEKDFGSIRAGRMRTSFGYSDWSDLFYTGINHKPLVREANLVRRTRLDRDDSGAEASVNFGPLQVQVALIDIYPTRAQVGPGELDRATLTAQYGFGPLILGVEALEKTDFSQKVYGGSFTYTVPHWLFKGEYFEGVGPGGAHGSYVDATYRIPFLVRSELCGRYDELRAAGSTTQTQLETVGFRYIFSKNLNANINYGWGRELTYSGYANNLGLAGWTARMMFQVQF